MLNFHHSILYQRDYTLLYCTTSYLISMHTIEYHRPDMITYGHNFEKAYSALESGIRTGFTSFPG